MEDSVGLDVLAPDARLVVSVGERETDAITSSVLLLDAVPEVVRWGEVSIMMDGDEGGVSIWLLLVDMMNIYMLQA